MGTDAHARRRYGRYSRVKASNTSMKNAKNTIAEISEQKSNPIPTFQDLDLQSLFRQRSDIASAQHTQKDVGQVKESTATSNSATGTADATINITTSNVTTSNATTSNATSSTTNATSNSATINMTTSKARAPRTNYINDTTEDSPTATPMDSEHTESLGMMFVMPSSDRGRGATQTDGFMRENSSSPQIHDPVAQSKYPSGYTVHESQSENVLDPNLPPGLLPVSQSRASSEPMNNLIGHCINALALDDNNDTTLDRNDDDNDGDSDDSDVPNLGDDVHETRSGHSQTRWLSQAPIVPPQWADAPAFASSSRYLAAPLTHLLFSSPLTTTAGSPPTDTSMQSTRAHSGVKEDISCGEKELSPQEEDEVSRLQQVLSAKCAEVQRQRLLQQVLLAQSLEKEISHKMEEMLILVSTWRERTDDMDEKESVARVPPADTTYPSMSEVEGRVASSITTMVRVRGGDGCAAAVVKAEQVRWRV